MLQVLSWLAVSGYAGGIWYLSSRGAEVTARVDAAGVSDLWAHLVLYGGLGIVLRVALWSSWPHRSELWFAGWAAGLAFVYGITDEIHQHFVPGRGTDVQDLVGNLAGAVGVQLLVLGLHWVWRHV